MAELKFEIPEGIGEGLFSEPSGEGFRVLVEAVAQALVNAQAEAHFGAPWNAKGLPRPNGYRNGFKARGLQTVAGALELSVPQARDGSFRPNLFERWQRSEKAMLAACAEMVLAGVSNRRASQLAESAFGAEVSPSLVSHLIKELEPAMAAFRDRPLGAFPYLLVDARFDRVREGHAVNSRAFLWVSGVNEEGQREVLGWLDWRGETRVAWETLFRSLKDRGMKDVRLVVSDAHEGLVQAAEEAFPGAQWQECQAHFLRRAVEQVKVAEQKAFRADMRAVLHAPDRERAMDELNLLRGRWGKKAAKGVAYLEEHLDSLLAVLNFPEGHHKRLRTTNMVERVNQELKRKGRLVRTWPNAASRERAYGLRLMEQHEAWSEVPWLKMQGAS
ncbi:MAG: IS256 family transposase [Acidobacteriota bacterium]|nr:IS256 family transposase [Acidobacteriota bacterium]